MVDRAFGFGRIALLSLALLLAGGGGEGLSAQDGTVLVVRVTDRLSGTPVRGAVVTLTPVDGEGAPRGQPRVYGTDASGGFRTAPMGSGLHLLDARAPGYQTLVQTIDVEGPSPVTLTFQLAPDVLEVEGVAGTAERNPFLDRGGFYDRQRRGLGSHYTRDELARLGIYQTTDLFRTLSGVEFDYAGSPTSPFIRFRQGCLPDIVVDGANLGPEVRLDDVVIPSAIEGLEVYRGAGMVPGSLSNSSCGAVIVWTLSRDPEGARPFSWNRLIFGVVVVAIAQIIRP